MHKRINRVNLVSEPRSTNSYSHPLDPKRKSGEDQEEKYKMRKNVWLFEIEKQNRNYT